MLSFLNNQIWNTSFENGSKTSVILSSSNFNSEQFVSKEDNISFKRYTVEVT